MFLSLLKELKQTREEGQSPKAKAEVMIEHLHMIAAVFEALETFGLDQGTCQ